MACTITDKEVDFQADNTAVGVGGLEYVTARVSVAPFYVQVDSNWLLDQKGTRSVVPDYQTGEWTLVLPGPDECLPADPSWVITRADGVAFTGQVPADVPGPVSMYDLVTTYGWTLSTESVTLNFNLINPSALTGEGTVPLAALSGITTNELSDTAGIVAGQIESIPDQDADIITSGQLDTAYGGLGIDTSGASDGDILYYSNGAWHRLARDTDGKVLTMVAGLPAWA